MAFYQNKASGPRVFALKSGKRVTLLPGQTGEMDFARGPDEDPVLKGWLANGELVETNAEEVEAQQAKATAVPGKAEDVFAAQAKMLEALDRQRAQELDLDRRTPPRQFAGDGGPGQGLTVDGRSGGALTPSQEEKGRADSQKPAAKAAEKPVQATAPAPAPAVAPAPAATTPPAPAPAATPKA